MQKKYDWLLFDADETLFDYPSHIGLARLAARYGIAWTDADYAQFQAVNQPLWRAYQEGRIDIGQLEARRFADLAARTGQPAPQRVLMIGDNPDTDIAGGARAGMDTAWYNPKGRACPEHVAPTYHIRHLQQLHAVVLPPH